MNTVPLDLPKSAGGDCRLHDPNGKWPTAKSLFGSFQVKRTLKLRTRKVKRTAKDPKRRRRCRSS